MTKKYDASEILVLEGIDPVRRRPAMYIGWTDKTGLYHLVWEILDNAIDEVMNGYASTITVELDKNGGCPQTPALCPPSLTIAMR